MTIVNVDFRGLEVVTAAWLSQDALLMKEIVSGVDIHEANRVAFNLPTRLVAKILKFRILYGGSAYSFSKDPDFKGVSTKVQYWEDVIDKYYTKYKGLKTWHDSLVRRATTGKTIVTPFGREYHFAPIKNPRGEIGYPVTDIKNYPVQGTGADIVAMSRVMIFKKMKGMKSKLVSTVHDSIVVDAVENEVDTICRILSEEIAKTPMYLSKYYGVDFNLPLVGEVGIGPNFADLTDVK